jgi:cytochrome c-type biogenesis protein CcmE
MKPSTRFAIGAGIIVGAVALMIVQGIQATGRYFLTPTQLISRTAADPHMYNLGLKVSAKVVPGSIRRDAVHHRIDFAITDGTRSFPVIYLGPSSSIPDTFTDANDIDVVVDGTYGHDGAFHATDVIAKCGSRYEPVMKQQSRST